jgi:4-hydroxythreonine-4-phosphate dehydrogenase
MTTLWVPTGDPAGIGPDVAVRACVERMDRARMVLFGDAERLVAGVRRASPSLTLLDEGDPRPTGLSIVDVGRVSEPAIACRAPSEQGGRAQLAALDAAIDRALARGGAVVTAPTSKEAVERAGVPFTGQTEHLARRAAVPDDAVTMMFLGPRLSVSLATTHLALRAVPDAITSARVERAIVHLAEALQQLVAGRPLRIAVSGLNPHAGEAGLFGREEVERVAPAVERARARLPEASLRGPLGAETALRQAAAGEVDGVVTMFHDQATIASKLLDWGAAVNVTWGLPFVRTSVDHGVAYDAAAAGTGDASGMGAALDLALRLTERA